MITYVLYNKDTAHERSATDMVERLKLDQIDAELLDADSPRGIAMAETYDVMARPAIMIMKTDGAPLQIWQGEDNWPPVGDVAYQARQ